MPRTDKLSTYATTISGDDEFSLIVTYHRTQIVKRKTDCIVLNTGGYNTVTTRRKMNQAANQFNLGYKVAQRKGDTFVSWRGEVYAYDDHRVMLMVHSGEVRNYDTGITIARLGGARS